MVDYNEDFFRKQRDGDKGTLARFFTKPKYMSFKSTEAKREILEERIYVEITLPGSKDVHTFEANSNHKRRFNAEWKAFEDGYKLEEKGTPIENIHEFTIQQKALLAAYNVRTIEQLAELHDAGADKLGIGSRAMIDVAKKYLQKLKFEKDEQTKTELDRLKERIAQLEAVNPQPATSKPNNRGAHFRKKPLAVDVTYEPINDSTKSLSPDKVV